MSMWLIGLVAVLAGGAFFMRRGGRGPSVTRMALDSVKSGETKPVVTAISELPESARPTAFDQAVRALWNAYERPMAARLVKDAAGWVATAPIIQYWIRQIREVEPEIAEEQFDEPFLTTFFKPEVAAQCGKFG